MIFRHIRQICPLMQIYGEHFKSMGFGILACSCSMNMLCIDKILHKNTLFTMSRISCVECWMASKMYNVAEMVQYGNIQILSGEEKKKKIKIIKNNVAQMVQYGN